MTIGITGIRLQVSDATRQRFERARALQGVYAVISSNLEYILALEYGHSQKQAPGGMIRLYRGVYRRILEESLQNALYATGYDFQAAAKLGVTEAALRILNEIVARTPVDTGRAKGSWVVTLPGGATQQGARPVSAERQKAIKKARQARKTAATTRKRTRAQALKVARAAKARARPKRKRRRR